MLTETRIKDLGAAIRGSVLMPGDADYDTTRRIFNAMIDRRPALIARCASAADVVACVGFARSEGLLVSVRGGGHNVSGKAVCDGGIMIDLSLMKGCRVDPAGKVAQAEPGLTLAELDRDCQAFGLATPTGIVSPTGIAGLTLGGGISWLNGTLGLACDNVLSADVVTADGRMRRASTTEHPDLHWAVRGGGGNLGIVTSFEYRLHPIGPMVAGGVAYPLAAARDVLRCYRDLVHGCPDELCANAGFASGPDGGPIVGIGVAWCGNLDAGERLIKPLRAAAVPVADEIGRMRYVDLQRGGDAAFPLGRRHYWKASFLRRLDDAVIDLLADFAARRPSPHTQIGLQRMHGAAARVDPASTAFPHRHAQWDCLILSQWGAPGDDERNIRWTRELHAALKPHVEAAVYVNDLGDDEADRVRQAYGENYERLKAIKKVYDPDNFFRGNQNVAAAP